MSNAIAETPEVNGPASYIKIAEDYSRTPGGRKKVTGPFSGEEFREKLLVPHLKSALSGHGYVNVVLDGVAGYPVSFLEEAFGGLVRVDHFAKADLNNVLKITANSGRFQTYSDLARRFIETAENE
ncbi:STAS-like domain-containing protein [Asticcacaulis sp. 201]|uniref:STAS-like domain-containing protein n=1 Tax=Asticcacaulis sp. 201 TaxID=3028787 RepID=UPI0029166135|nr:DUF4325 domain-containing protein [Asticcacaulis sp. 201]MDV6329943.1 DUF4325 domain-containing protein [Asticcacaulis sp. 201]